MSGAADMLDTQLGFELEPSTLQARPFHELGLNELCDLADHLERLAATVDEAIAAHVLADVDVERDGPILAAHDWTTNGHLIADVAELYLEPSWRILDPTFGRGIWWQRWRPDPELGGELVTYGPDDRRAGFDFRAMAHDADSFDAVAFDPPYVSVGGRKTTGIADMHDGYGLTDAPTTPAGVQQLIDDGLTEVARVVRPGGVVLVKCQDYISSGRLWRGTHRTLTHALELGFELVDRLEHIAGVRPQPAGRRQVHARRNLSTLFVLRAPKGARK